MTNPSLTFHVASEGDTDDILDVEARAFGYSKEANLVAEKNEPYSLTTHSMKGMPTLDIPRIFTISESEHRIHNPFTEEKYATLGRVLRMKPDTQILDLGSGSGEMLCTWARDHAITGVGIDMSQLFSEQARRRGLCRRDMDCWWVCWNGRTAGAEPKTGRDHAYR